MKKLIYSLSLLCVLLAIAAFTLLCCYLAAADGYNRLYLERNNLQNQVYELERQNKSLQYEIENPRVKIEPGFATVR